MKIDGHIHFAEDMQAVRLKQVIEQQNLSGIALLCIPKGGERPVEEDAFSFRAESQIPVWIFGGINRAIYELADPAKMQGALTGEISRLLTMGCTGIKMLEGKPDVRKYCSIPDFDSVIWEPFWAEAERRQIPIIMHVNDPEEFWDAEKISEHAKAAGWIYDDTFVNNEAQYLQMQKVLEQHPRLRILFPHFFFLSKQLTRLSSMMEEFCNVYIDLTPGAELYYNLAENHREAEAFFAKFGERICYGTDMGARSVIWKGANPLSLEECEAREALITRFLETKGTYTQQADGVFVKERKPTQMHGLGLEKEELERIYSKNFLSFIKQEA